MAAVRRYSAAMFARTLMFALCFALTGFSVPAYAETPACHEEIERGEASWYGPGFEGKRTKSEERFDPNAMSAAHPDLPFGTMVKVTNMRNARSVLVRINDRGAFGHHRVIDLSKGAAAKIGMLDAGTAAVSLKKCGQ